MLESQALLLQRTQDTQSAQNDRWMVILDPLSRAPIGSVHGNRPWSRWVGPSAWDVFESEDLSHVFSLRRRWPWSAEWLVDDAEGRNVGNILTPPQRLTDLRLFASDVRRPGIQRVRETRIEDPQGRCIARLDERGGTALFLSLAGTELASLCRRDQESELTFVDGTRNDPFTRMLLLAAALVCG